MVQPYKGILYANEYEKTQLIVSIMGVSKNYHVDHKRMLPKITLYTHVRIRSWKNNFTY